MLQIGIYKHLLAEFSNNDYFKIDAIDKNILKRIENLTESEAEYATFNNKDGKADPDKGAVIDVADIVTVQQFCWILTDTKTTISVCDDNKDKAPNGCLEEAKWIKLKKYVIKYNSIKIDPRWVAIFAKEFNTTWPIPPSNSPFTASNQRDWVGLSVIHGTLEPSDRVSKEDEQVDHWHLAGMYF